MKSSQFKHPSLEEVQRLFLLKGVNSNEYEKFFYHYQSNGWYVGKSKMRSWRAAAAGWILRMKDFAADKPTPIKPMDTSLKSDAIKQAEEAQIRLAYRNQRQ